MVKRIILLLLGAVLLIPAQSTLAQNGLDLNGYCRDKGWGRATLNGDTAYDWQCVSGSTYRDMNLDEACQMQYGSGFTADYRSYDDPYSWYCEAPASSSSSNTQSSSPPPSSSSNTVTATVTISSCPNTYTTGVRVGGQARVTPGLANIIRSGAGTDNRRVGTALPGVVFNVIGGPICADGYKWWQINYNGTVGWTVEGDDDEAWIEVYNSPLNSSDLGDTCEAMASASLSAYNVRRCAQSAFNGLPDGTLMVNYTVASLECVVGVGPDFIQSLISNLRFYGANNWHVAVLASVSVDTPQNVGECLVDLGSTFFE